MRAGWRDIWHLITLFSTFSMASQSFHFNSSRSSSRSPCPMYAIFCWFLSISQILRDIFSFHLLLIASFHFVDTYFGFIFYDIIKGLLSVHFRFLHFAIHVQPQMASCHGGGYRISQFLHWGNLLLE